jgi:uncharacterized protein
VKLVVHLSDDDPSTHDGVLGNIENVLADETLTIEAVALVTNGGGVPLLASEGPHRERVVALGSRGVSLKACRNSLEGGDLSAADLIERVEIVPSGIGEVARLQSEAGYAYFKP